MSYKKNLCNELHILCFIVRNVLLYFPFPSQLIHCMLLMQTKGLECSASGIIFILIIVSFGIEVLLFGIEVLLFNCNAYNAS